MSMCVCVSMSEEGKEERKGREERKRGKEERKVGSEREGERVKERGR